MIWLSLSSQSFDCDLMKSDITKLITKYYSLLMFLLLTAGGLIY